MMEKRITRWGAVARFTHWVTLIVVIVLIYTGLALYVPGVNSLANLVGGFFVARTLHRIAGIFFIVIPLLMIIFNWDAFKKWLGEVFYWRKDDSAWFLRFPLYFFRPSAKMPPVHGKSTSGQRVLTWLIIAGAVIQVITGPILWFRPFSKTVIIWSTFFHDLGFLIIGIGLLFHIYVGLGIFKPYRGVWRGMLGRGSVPEELAEKLWPEWAAEQKKIGKVE